MQVVPYKEAREGKKEQVATMFNNISSKYDFLNHFLSGGTDYLWRRKAIKLLAKEAPKKILDVATGTGDFAIEALKLNPEKIIGIDISEGMLKVGREKIKNLGADQIIELQKGDSENIKFENNYFDAGIVSFGVRNFENLEKGLQEMHRVLRNDGTIVVLEFSKPQGFFFKRVFRFYFKYILPAIGRLISKDTSAYTYLPESVDKFPYGQDFLNILSKVGFKSTRCISLTFGIASIYLGKKA